MESVNGAVVRTILATSAAYGSFKVARYEQNGSLDATFGAGGIVDSNVGGVSHGLALQSDGRIVVVGSAAGTFLAARYCR